MSKLVKNKLANLKVNHSNRILKSLMHYPIMTFNQLWDKEGRSNNFAYHIKSLEKEGLIKKSEGKTTGYKLTKKGVSHISYLNGQTGQEQKLPIVAVAIVLFNKENNQILMHQRTKEPFHGYWGFPSSKLKFENYILEEAKACLKEDTGLTADLELKGLFSSKTKDEDQTLLHHQIFIIKGTNSSGSLIKENENGNNKWIKKEKISSLELLPNIKHLISIAESDKFRWIEADRISKGEEITEIKVKKDIKFY